jgi:hypothetical protein
MTDRERWIVYPLLFLALGASLRDKLGGRTTTKSIVCQDLRIEDEAVGNQPPRLLAMIGRTEATPTAPSKGVLIINGEVAVDGDVKVNGAIDAKQYAYDPVANIVRAVQAAVDRQQAQPRQTKPPSGVPAESADSAPPRGEPEDAATKK